MFPALWRSRAAACPWHHGTALPASSVPAPARQPRKQELLQALARLCHPSQNTLPVCQQCTGRADSAPVTALRTPEHHTTTFREVCALSWASSSSRVHAGTGAPVPLWHTHGQFISMLTSQPCDILHQTPTVLWSRRRQTHSPMVRLSISRLLSLGFPWFEDNSQDKKGFQDFLLLFMLPETMFFSQKCHIPRPQQSKGRAAVMLGTRGAKHGGKQSSLENRSPEGRQGYWAGKQLAQGSARTRLHLLRCEHLSA